MANYKNIKGFQIQSRAADPVPGVAAWSSGGAMPSTRQAGGGAGIQNAGMVIGGSDDPGGISATCFTYDGAAWTAAPSLNVAGGSLCGFGATNTAAVAAGRWDSPNNSDTETFNGSSWTEQGNFPGGPGQMAATGTQTLGLGMSGSTPLTTESYTFNGTAWSDNTNFNTGRYGAASFGLQTAANLVCGQEPGNRSDLNEEWNGTSWTEKAETNQQRSSNSNSGWGTSTAGMIMGGADGPVLAQTEIWNGTSWTEVGDLATARANSTGASKGGTTSAGLYCGGVDNPSLTSETAVVEEWNDDAPYSTASVLVEGDMWFNTATQALKVYGKAAGIPTATWASGGALNTGVQKAAGLGTQTAALCVSGESTDKVEEYNGTGWTEVTEVGAIREQASSAGTTTSGLFFGGSAPGGVTTANESWNGASWTEKAELNTARRGSGGSGPSDTAAIMSTGYTTANVANSELWNGVSWTEVNEVNTARRTLASGGTSSTLSLIAGGYEPGSNSNKAETWNGTSWTEISNINTARDYVAGAPSTASTGLIFGSPGTTPKGITEYYDGSSWTEIGDMATENGMRASAGSPSAALAAGAGPGNSTATEEFASPATVNTVTVS